MFEYNNVLCCLHWRRQGGQPPANGRVKKNFFVKIEGLSSLPPAKSCRACYDNPTGRGYFYQMPNIYTCIAYLIEIRKFCSKNLVHKGDNFEAQNALRDKRGEPPPNSHSWLRHWLSVGIRRRVGWTTSWRGILPTTVALPSYAFCPRKSGSRTSYSSTSQYIHAELSTLSQKIYI